MALEKLKYSSITEAIIGCAIQVHKQLGSGFQEVIYQRALEKELKKANIAFDREVELPVYYDEEVIGKRRIDFLVEGKIVVELKALADLDKSHLNQTLNYLEATRLEIGLILNFGSTRVQSKRVTNVRRLSND